MANYVSNDDTVDMDILRKFSMVCSIDHMPQLISMTEKASYDFASYTKNGSKISQFYASVGSVNISSPPWRLFYDDP